MKDDIKNKIELIVDTLMNQLHQNLEKQTLCTNCTAQFINYYISKGFIFEHEKRECSKFACNYLNNKYFALMPTPDWILEGLVDMMVAEQKFNYEDLIFPITQLFIKNKL